MSGCHRPAIQYNDRTERLWGDNWCDACLQPRGSNGCTVWVEKTEVRKRRQRQELKRIQTTEWGVRRRVVDVWWKSQDTVTVFSLQWCRSSALMADRSLWHNSVACVASREQREAWEWVLFGEGWYIERFWLETSQWLSCQKQERMFVCVRERNWGSREWEKVHVVSVISQPIGC